MVRPYIRESEQQKYNAEKDALKREYLKANNGVLSRDMEVIFQKVRIPTRAELENTNSTNPLLTDAEYGFLKEAFIQQRDVLLTDLVYNGSYYLGAYGKTSQLKKNLQLRGFLIDKQTNIEGEKKKFSFNPYAISGLMYEIYARSDWDFLLKHMDVICQNPVASDLFRKFNKITKDLHSNPQFVSIQFPLFFAKFLLNPDGFVLLFTDKLNIMTVVGCLNDREFLQMFFLSTYDFFKHMPKNFEDTFSGKLKKKLNDFSRLQNSAKETAEDSEKKVAFDKKLSKYADKHIKRLKLMETVLGGNADSPKVHSTRKSNAVAPSTSSEYNVPLEYNHKPLFTQDEVIENINHSNEVLDYEVRD